LQNFCFL